MRPWRGWLLLAGCIAAAPAVAGEAAPGGIQLAQARAFDIPAQPLIPALLRFSDITGIQLFFDSSMARALRSPGASGSLPPEEALRRLLAGSGLGYRFTNATTVTLVPAPAPAAGEDGAVRLPEIQVETGVQPGWGPLRGYVPVVSAGSSRTDTPLLETPQAVTVIGRDQVQAQNARSLVDAVRYAPGVAAGHNPVDNRFASLRIRGFEPTLFVDGMQLPYGASLYGRPMVDPFALERIEILRGPSSALYGQVPPGGMVNFVSLRPPADPVHRLQLQADSNGQVQGGFDLGGPLDPDGRILYRLTGLAYGGGTQIDHVDDQRILIAPAITWRPTADTTLTLLGQFQRDVSGVEIQFLPAQGTLLPNPNGRLNYGTFVGEPGYDGYRRTQYWFGYLFEHRFDDTWTVRQNFRYAGLETNLFAVYGSGLRADLRTLNRQTLDIAENANAITVDNQLQARFATGPLAHTLLFGFDYRHAASDIDFLAGTAPPIDIFNRVYGAAIPPLQRIMSNRQSQDQFGLYLQDQIALGRWRLTLSGRHDWVQTTTDNRMAGTSRDQSDAAFSGRAGLNYVFDIGLSPYIAYARSFQPTLGVSYGGDTFRPTTGEQYEAGIKYQPPGTNLAVNAALFTVSQRNALTTDPGHTGFSVQTGEIRAQGFELDASMSLTGGLNLLASYTYTDAEVTRSNGADLGHRVITVPRHQAALWLDYSFAAGPLHGLSLGGGIRYFGDTYGNAANTLRIPDYTLVDASLRYDLGRLSPHLRGAQFAVNASNLFDRRYVATCTAVTSCYLGAGRLVTAGLRYTW